MTYVSHTPEDRRQMLDRIGVRSLDDLLTPIPSALRLKGPLAVGEPLSEVELTAHLESLAAQNTGPDRLISFLGGGIYDHYVPAAVDALASRSEFYTAYTPYQPEVAQGTLQATYEFQSQICRLTGMDAANASLYDGASAVAEAALVAVAATGRLDIVVSGTVNPRYREVLTTYTQGRGVLIDCVPDQNGISDSDMIVGKTSHQTAGVIVQSPNFFGQLEDVTRIEQAVHRVGGQLIYVFYPISLGMCRTPGEANADLAVGEGQSLGNPPNFGGPLLGLFAARKDHVRRMPGRIVGRTVDEQGRPGYVLTLQTREQHIRREKATSNICTSQALLATRAAIYLSLLGKAGFPALAEVCARRAHCLAERIVVIPGCALRYHGPFFNEFVISCPVPAAQIVAFMADRGVLPGIDLSLFFPRRTHELLLCVTEKHSPDQLDRYVEVLSQAVSAG